MFHIILHRPEIPPNTGNIIRLAANCGARLHLIKPLGFSLDDKRLRRAGLDYHETAQVRAYDNLTDCLQAAQPPRLFAFTPAAARVYADENFARNDAFLFGSESAGLPPETLAQIPAAQILRLPMRAGQRSLNLANTVAAVVYEAWRQCNFDGAKKNGESDSS